MTETGKTLLNLGLTALVSAGTNVVVNELSKSGADRSASVGGNVDIEALKVQLKEYLISSLEQDAILIARLRGQQGLKGDKGDTGNPGINGENLRNFSDTIFRNSDLSMNNMTGFVTNPSSSFIADLLDGLPQLSINSSTVQNSLYGDTFVPIDPRKLYKVSYFCKGSVVGVVDVRIACYNINKVATMKATGDSTAAYSNLSASTSYAKKTSYLGGIGNLNQNFGADTVFGKIKLVSNLGVIGYYNRIVINEVPIGEPVPFNLHFLPEGQMVYDPTDGSVGRYDGTTIHWFTMA